MIAHTGGGPTCPQQHVSKYVGCGVLVGFELATEARKGIEVYKAN
jgi:hypothetical protein